LNKEKVFKVMVQDRNDLSRFYTFWLNEEEYAAFWKWWRTEIKAKRPPREGA